MYVVAITRWARPVEQEVATLAPLLGATAYDLKLRLAGPLPVVLARMADVAQARQLLGVARKRGHGAIACDLAQVKDSSQLLTPRGYAFEERAFVAHEATGEEHRVAFADIVALLRASASTIERHSTVDKKRQLSFGRAVMTGGIVMRKTKTTEKRATTEESEQVLYIVQKGNQGSVLLREQHLRHQGLGERVRPTKLENFEVLVSLLRQCVPGAFYDDRLLTQKRKRSSLSVAGNTSQSVLATSNASENDLAAHLLVVAHLTGQL